MPLKFDRDGHYRSFSDRVGLLTMGLGPLIVLLQIDV